MNTTIYIAYSTDGDCEVSTEDAGTALDALLENYGHCGGTRVVAMTLALPAIRTLEVSASIPDTDGQITVEVK